jgi:hypothetical protein
MHSMHTILLFYIRFGCVYYSMNMFDQGPDWMVQKKCIECNHMAMMRIDQKALCVGCKKGEFL